MKKWMLAELLSGLILLISVSVGLGSLNDCPMFDPKLAIITAFLSAWRWRVDDTRCKTINYRCDFKCFGKKSFRNYPEALRVRYIHAIPSFMFEILKIKLLGYQPVARVTDEMLERIIQRDYGNLAAEVRQKLQYVVASNSNGRNRISAAILKLANMDFLAIDRFVEVGNNDFRDVVVAAEYPSFSGVGFGLVSKSEKRKLYLSDWKEYIAWINKI